MPPLLELVCVTVTVFNVPDKAIKVFEILNNVPGSAIIYCRSRAETKNIAQLLQLKNISADHYHAGLSNDERSRKQQEWMNNKLRVIVATNAFGMGIDKPDVRAVIHLYVPDCIESYYQEAGRAGRDDKKAFAVLVYNDKDIQQLSQLNNKRYPTIDTIKEVYQSLVNYLQIAAGCGEGLYFDFNLEYFIEHFKLETNLIVNVLKILEQEGHIVSAEGSLTPSMIQFISDKESIESISDGYPELGDIIKALMRSYSGIFDSSVYINEYKLAAFCKLPVDVLVKRLKALVDFGIIDFQPKKTSPQILFLQNRASASQLYIDTEAYFERKKRFEVRVEKQRDYLHNKNICRSKFIADYFDVLSEDCGVCDVCIALKKKTITANDFETIKNHLLILLSHEEVEIEDILTNNQFNKDKFWEVVNYLQEQEIITSKDGRIKKM